MPDQDDVAALIERIVAAAGVSDERQRADLRRELWTHFEDAGFTRQALRRFGSAQEIGAALRRVHGPQPVIPRPTWRTRIESVLLDLRFAVRMLRRSPGFSLVAILCLGLGIGATTAVSSWIEGILLRPYPLVSHQERLFAMTGTNRGGGRGLDDISWPDFLDLQRRCTLFDAFIAEKITGATLGVSDRAERITGSVVSANYFDALGVRPALGRAFQPGEDVGRNAHPVVVISYQLWTDRFGSDPSIVGRALVLNGMPHTVVGVAPQGFYGTFVGYAFQFWVPVSMQPQHIDAGVYHLDDRGARWIEGFARVKPGVSMAQAQAELSAVAARLETEYATTDRGRGVRLFRLWETPFNVAGALMPTLSIALAVVVLVLLIACANVGNLLLVRAFARRQEMTIRLAVGAARARLVRQLLTEGVVLSACAAVCGLAIAFWGRDTLVAITPPRSAPLRLPAEFDWRVIALTTGAALLATLVFALAPAVIGSRIDLAGALRSESQSVAGGRARLWFRSSLVVIQVSMSLVLLVGAALLVRTLDGMRSASPGFSADRVLVTGLNLFTAGYTPERVSRFENDLLERVQRLPGVEAASLSRLTPFSYRGYSSATIGVDGYDAPPDQQPIVNYNEIGPGYLATMGIPLLAGRDFTRTDDASSEPVAIVDETMAAQFWRDGQPIDRRLRAGQRSMRVIGIAAASKYRDLLETPKPFFYVPLRQNFTGDVALQIRTLEPPALIAPALTGEIHALDATIRVPELITMREQIRRTTTAQTFAMTMLSAAGLVALALAAIGLYGVMSSAVSQARRELAVRMALGASGGALLRHVLSHGVALTSLGLALGLAVAFETTRLMGYLLYDVSPHDPLAFGSAVAVIAIASVTACFVPAWRAGRTDPLRALRS